MSTPDFSPSQMSFTGRCHCGKVRLQLEMREHPAILQPRACDCTYCQSRNAAYVSDPQGRLRIQVGAGAELRTERQGAQLADFLCCASCATLVAVCYRDAEGIFAAVNLRVLEQTGQFAAPLEVSPQRLTPEEKVARWKQAWFGDVQIRQAQPAPDQ